MNIPQADRWLSTDILRKIGGVRTYGQRLQFYLGMINTATLMLVLYNTSPLVNNFFPSVAVWLAFIVLVVVPSVMGVDFFVFHPSQITYNMHQSGQENRSPNYRETMENQRRIDELHEKVDQLTHQQIAADGGEDG